MPTLKFHFIHKRHKLLKQTFSLVFQSRARFHVSCVFHSVFLSLCVSLSCLFCVLCVFVQIIFFFFCIQRCPSVPRIIVLFSKYFHSKSKTSGKTTHSSTSASIELIKANGRSDNYKKKKYKKRKQSTPTITS